MDDPAADMLRQFLSGPGPVVLIGGIIAIVAIVFGSVSSMVRATARERSRREIAAFIAEGTMTPEQGERLMAAGEKKGGCG